MRSHGWPYGAGMSSSVSEQALERVPRRIQAMIALCRSVPEAHLCYLLHEGTKNESRSENWRLVVFRELVASDDRTVESLVPTTLTYETEGGCNDGPTKSKEQWSVDELKALTEFFLSHTSGESWPTHKQDAFWNSASEFVKSRGGAVDVVRSGRCLDC